MQKGLAVEIGRVKPIPRIVRAKYIMFTPRAFSFFPARGFSQIINNCIFSQYMFFFLGKNHMPYCRVIQLRFLCYKEENFLQRVIELGFLIV